MMSYISMLGLYSDTTEIINKHALPIQPIQWYDYKSLNHALTIKYQTSY